MQKILNKLIATILTVIFVGTNFIPSIAYAAGEIEQNAKTSQENVEFDANINDSYDATINVNEEGKLKLNLKVLGTGYVKDATVTLNDNNYQLIEQKEIEIENGNAIKLNEVNAGEELNLTIPIKVNKQETVLANEMKRESSVTLNATYINEKGKEKEISKTLKLNLTWTNEIRAKVEQTLVRNIRYDGKTMLSFKINDGIVDNTIPYSTKKINVQVPNLNGVKPSNVIVIGENIKYNYENDQITIEKENIANEEGKIKWNSQDSYMVTYIYETEEVPTSIETKAVATITANEQKVEAETEEDTYELGEEKGSLVETEITGTNEISKGYMYTNLSKQKDKLETEYNLTYTVNIGYKDLIDKIVIKEQNSLLGNKETNGVKTKRITIDKDNLIKILGEEGSIRVTNQEGKEIGKFYKGLTEITTEETGLVFETSKPIQEGNLSINITKAIIDNQEYDKDALSKIKEMTTRVIVESYNGESQISSTQNTKIINLKEPTSEANIDINMDNLSTVVKNEDVILTATLETNSIEKALYKNPRVKITLPEEVKSINLKEAKLIYEDELKPARFETNGNNIELDLSGMQTKYSSQSTSEGTVLRVVADIDLDNLATTKQREVKLAYSNEATGEVREVVEPVGIVAPTEFITTNELEVDGKKLTAQESEKSAKIKANSEEKEATISGTIINNLGMDTQGVTIIGNIPSNTEDKSMGTSLKTEVNIEGANAEIYYSNNIDEDINGSGWTHDATTDSKAFKAVLIDNLADKEAVNFNYKVNVPANVGYEKIAQSNYTVYYNNDAQEGNTKNAVMAKAVAMETGEPNPLKMQVSIINAETKQEVANGADVQDGTYLTYKLKITNSGKENISNVKLVTDYPDEINLVIFEEIAGVKNSRIDKMTKKFTHNISEIKAGESKEFTSDLVVMSGIEDDSKKNAIITSTATADNIDEELQSTNQINAVKGNLGVMDYVVENELVAGDEFNYSLDIMNPSKEPKKNVQVTIAIPEEFEFKSIDERNYTYDENSHILTYKIDTLSGNGKNNTNVRLKTKQLTSDKTVKISAKIKCDGMDGEKQSPSVEYKIIANIVSVEYTSSITDGKLTDKDKLIYYIDIKNNTSKDIIVNLTDKLPNALSVRSYTKTDSNGELALDFTGRIILEKLSIKAKQTGKIAIVTDPYILEQGKNVNIENKPKINVNGNNIEVKSITHTIVGTSDFSSSDPSNWGDVNDGNDDELNTEKGTYIISGVAWLDKNADGKKDESEDKLSGQDVKLYNKDTGRLAVDVNEKELTTKTSNVGKYSFTNVVPGNYIVVIEYDNKVYELTNYKAQDLVESEDSDFINATLDGKDIAATNTIAIIDSNIYNIDLGLVNRNRFDLKLEKTVKRITVTNTKDNIKTKIYDFDNKAIAKVELPNENIDTATVTVEYAIKIANEGSIAGYAKSVVDYLPNGMTFNSELNTSWYIGNDGNAYNTSLSNTIINPGETKEIRLVLTRKMNDTNLGTVRNTAEIASSYNEYGLEDIDSIAGNKKTGEDDMSSVDTIIGTATGKTTIAILGITLGILSIIATAVYVTKKYVINKIV